MMTIANHLTSPFHHHSIIRPILFWLQPTIYHKMKQDIFATAWHISYTHAYSDHACHIHSLSLTDYFSVLTPDVAKSAKQDLLGEITGEHLQTGRLSYHPTNSMKTLRLINGQNFSISVIYVLQDVSCASLTSWNLCCVRRVWTVLLSSFSSALQRRRRLSVEYFLTFASSAVNYKQHLKVLLLLLLHSFNGMAVASAGQYANVDSRSAELHNVKEWALANNLKLNLTKSQEIIFTDQRRKTKFSIPDEIPLLSTGTNYQNSWRHIYQ